MMLVCLTGLLFLSENISAQTPGGIGLGNLTVWLKADGSTTSNHSVYAAAGTGTTSGDGEVVNHWDNLNPGGTRIVNLVQTNGIQQPKFYNTSASNLFNYNPMVLFDGTNDVLRSAATAGSNIFNGNQNTIFQVMNYRGPDVTGVWFKWESAPTEENRIGYESVGAGNDYKRFDVFNGTNCTGGTPCPTRQNQGSTKKIDDRFRLSTAHHNNTQSVTRVDGAIEKTQNFAAGSIADITLTAVQPLNLGANSNLGAGDFWTNIGFSEVLIYNTRLTPTQIDLVESYLGLKYGISLNHNYFASDSSVFWNNVTNASYNYGIIGLGRDDGSGLLQKQSKSMSVLNEAAVERDILTLYLDNLQANNQGNSGTFLSGDKSFFLVGSNRATTLGTVTTENPASVAKTVNREWLVQQSNFSNTDVSMEFDFTNATSIFSGPVCQKPSLLIDADGNFSNATLVADSACKLVLVGNVIKITVPYSLFTGQPYLTFGFVNKGDTASSTLIHPKCFGGNDGSITVQTPLGATLPISYSLDGTTFQAGNSFTGLVGGVYYPIVRDNAGCLFKDTVQLNNPTDLSVTGAFQQPSCFGYTNGKAYVTSKAGGVAPYSLLWSTGVTTDTTVVGAGVYKVVITDANGCKDSTEVTVMQPTKLDIDTTVTPTSCPLVVDGKIVATATGGTTPYTFNRNTAAYTSSGTFSNLLSGTYTVRVKDAKGCLDSAIVNVLTGSPPTVIAPNDTAICPNLKVALAGTGTSGVSYSWTGGISNGVPFTVTAAKKYFLTGTDANGCQGTDSTLVTLAVVPNSTINPVPPIICNDTTSIQLSAATTGGSWRGTGITDASAGLFSPQVSGGGTFNVIYEVTTTCTDDDTLAITVTPRQDAMINPAGPFCTNAGNQQLTAVQAGGTWSGTGINSSGLFNPAAAGNGNHVISYALGGSCPNTGTITIAVNSAFNAQIIPSGPYCVSDASVQLQSVTPGASWSGNGIVSAQNGTFDPAVAGVGTHTITHTIAGSCGSTDTEQFTVLPLDTVHIQLPNDSICYNASPMQLGADIAGGTWLGAVSNTGLFDPVNKPPGNYKIYYEYQQNCRYTDSVIVVIPDTLMATMADATVPCFGYTTATLQVLPSSGAAPYTYTWADDASATSASRTNRGLGTYTATVTDALGCSIQATAQVTQPTQLIIPGSSLVIVDDSCFQANKGAVSLMATGGTPNPSTGKYVYSISPNAGTPNAAQNGFTGLGAGSYTLTATDNNNCTAMIIITITEPQLLQVFASTLTDYCAQAIGSARVDSAKGGTSPYTYLWSTGDPGATLANLPSASYTVVATDKLNCKASINVSVGNVPPPVIKADSLWVTCFGGNDGGATTTVTGATGAVTYVWSDGLGVNQATRNNFKQGNYWVEVTDSKQCVGKDFFQVPEPNDIFMSGVSGALLCYGIPYVGNFNVAGGNGAPFTYYLNNAQQSNESYSISAAGNYAAYATDQKGCYSNTITFVLTENPKIVAGSLADQTVCRGDVATFVASGSGGNGNLRFAFDNLPPSPNPVISYSTGAGTNSPQPVKVVITDGCSQPDSVFANLWLFQDPMVNIAYNPPSGCYPLTVNFSITTNLSSYTFDLDDNGVSTQLGSFSHTYQHVGTYLPNISGQTADGCSLSENLSQPIVVSGYPVPDFDWNPENPTVINNSIQLNNESVAANEYRWYIMDSTFTDTLFRLTDRNPMLVMPELANRYGVMLYAIAQPSGCYDSLLKYIDVEEELQVFIPNTFTPNGDAINEVFKPSLLFIDPLEYRFEIYNRWGERIFSTTNPADGWDGDYQGEVSKSDVYTYVLRYRKIDKSNKIKLTGNFRLMR